MQRTHTIFGPKNGSDHLGQRDFGADSQITPSQLKRVLAPVSITVDVERNETTQRIERFIINEV